MPSSSRVTNPATWVLGSVCFAPGVPRAGRPAPLCGRDGAARRPPEASVREAGLVGKGGERVADVTAGSLWSFASLTRCGASTLHVWSSGQRCPFLELAASGGAVYTVGWGEAWLSWAEKRRWGSWGSWGPVQAPPRAGPSSGAPPACVDLERGLHRAEPGGHRSCTSKSLSPSHVRRCVKCCVCIN